MDALLVLPSSLRQQSVDARVLTLPGSELIGTVGYWCECSFLNSLENRFVPRWTGGQGKDAKRYAK
jgi:hypothetical protein